MTDSTPAVPDGARTGPALRVFPAVLGWANPTQAPTSLRLYDGTVPNARWANNRHGRVIEQAIEESVGALEGSRVLVVVVGDRFTTAEQMARVRDAIEGLDRTSDDG